MVQLFCKERLQSLQHTRLTVRNGDVLLHIDPISGVRDGELALRNRLIDGTDKDGKCQEMREHSHLQSTIKPSLVNFFFQSTNHSNEAW